MNVSSSNILGLEEFLPIVQVESLRQHNWDFQRQYVLQKSSFFKRLWGSVKAPENLNDLPRLPLCDKTMLRESQKNFPPFGEYLAANSNEVIRFHRTSGSTGQGVNIAQTQFDAEQTARVGGRSHRACGLKPNHLVIHCLNYQIWMGGITDHLSLEAVGATVIPFGIGNRKLLLQTIMELGVDAIHSTPSYPAVLEQSIAQHYPELSPRDLGLELALFGGEAGLDNIGFRRRLENTWGYAVRNANYGVSDVFSNFAGQCEFNNDLHFVGHDVLYPEVIDPKTLNPLPWEDGIQGELVLTHLARRAQPLVRFRTNDSIVITETDVCACGRTTPRFRVLGRTDDMIVIRGVNVYPAAIGGVMDEFRQLSGEFRIRLKGKEPNHQVRVEAELNDDVQSTETFIEKIEKAIKFSLGVSVRVVLAPPRSLPRTEGKTQHLIRENST